MSTATAQHAPALPAGGAYPSDQNPDGSWNVRDVPVFAAHVRFGKRITRVWLERAVAKAAAQQSAGYIAPLHVAHHGSGQAVERAGYILPRRVQDVAFGGGPARPTLVADLLSVPAEVYERIRAGALPYRSVEVADLAVPEVTSLALLEHDAPFFKFPLLTVGSERPQAQPAQASAGARYLYHATEGPMAKRYMTPEVDEAKDALAAAKDSVIAKLEAIGQALETVLADMGVDAPAEDEAAAEEEPPVEEVAAADPEEKDDLAPAEAPMAAHAQALPGLSTQRDAQFAAMQGRLKVIEGELAATKRAAAKELAVSTAAKELSIYAGDFRAGLAKAYDLGGEANVREYVGTIKTVGLERSPETFSGDLPAPNEPPEVTAYTYAGPAKLREARRMAHLYSESRAARSCGSLESFIATQIGAPPARNGSAATAGRS